MSQPSHNGLYIMLISMHGLIRGNNMELGRDADTGGQIKYVVELAKALGAHPEVSRVELLTRQIFDKKISSDYSIAIEKLSSNVSIVRLPCGPRRYLRKEVLWPYLDIYVDNVLQHLRKARRTPDLVHAHYADGGYVGSRLVQLLGVPLVFTGHSLGRVKKQRLLEKGSKESTIESQYNIAQRIEAEEITLGNANVVITSTHQEVEEQYAIYENYHPRRMMVIPPGVDLTRFHTKTEKQEQNAPIKQQIDRFLADPQKPMILALSRADERKNIASLVRAFGEHPTLKQMANLVIIAGNRDDISVMDKGAREVLSQLLLLIDRYDLYGHIAYPKHHEADDVPKIYRLTAASKGVFINPALTEPFGLTIIEAAACGLPVVATNDGGPRDILGACDNGILINPLDTVEMANAIEKILTDKALWTKYSRNSHQGAFKHYSWESHVDKYIKVVKNVVGRPKRASDIAASRKSRLLSVDKLLVCDVDDTLLGDKPGLEKLLDAISQAQDRVGLAVVTGRRIDSTMEILNKWSVPVPDVLITAVGSEIYYGHRMVEDTDWTKHINYRWKPEALREAMRDFPGLKLQKAREQRRFKISYDVDPSLMPSLKVIRAQLRKRDLHAKLIYSHQAYLDLLPVRASKGLAMQYLTIKWGLDPRKILVAGDSGNDEEMLRGNNLGVIVANYSKELAKLRGRPDIYFAEGAYAWGILEGMNHYHFLENNSAIGPDDQEYLQEQYELAEQHKE
ncbi:HAD-IIB family hydrolase [Kaarinaea lacus]